MFGRDRQTLGAGLHPGSLEENLPAGGEDAPKGTQEDTIEGDTRNPEDELYDSNDEQIGGVSADLKRNPGSRLRPSKVFSASNAFKGERQVPNRRYTLELGDNDAINLMDSTNPTRKVIEQIANRSKFLEAVNAKPWMWQDAFYTNINEIITMRKNNAILESRLEHSEKREADTDKLSKELQKEVDRLRARRNRYQQMNNTLNNENNELMREVAMLKEQANQQRQNDYDSNDDHGSHASHRRPMDHELLNNPSRHRTPATPHRPGPYTETEAVGGGYSVKQREIPLFYGDRDRNEYESWRMAILARFKNFPLHFTTEGIKLDFIRESLRGTAFRIIEARINPDGNYPYQSHQEAIRDLDSSFKVHNAYSKAMGELNSPSMRMGYKNSNKTFDEFYARFLTVVSSLNLDDRAKMEFLKLNLSARLLNNATGATAMNPSFEHYVQILRATDVDMGVIDARRPYQDRRSRNEPTPTSTLAARPFRRAKAPPAAANPQRGPKMPTETLQQLRKEGRCYKCLKPGHISTDADAPCKNSPFLTVREMETRLAEVDIIWDGHEASDGYIEEDLGDDESEN